MNQELLIILTRNPELGKVKTRLAKTIGDEAALTIYKFLLHHTVTVTQNLTCDKIVYYSENVIKNDLWNNSIYQKEQQQGVNFGERMENAFKKAFKHYDRVVIIGSDILEITQQHIENAFNALKTHDAVIGPAQDGGYYLLGLTSIPKNIFKNKQWGTATVFKDTLNDISSLKTFLLEELNDIDVFEDIKNNPVFTPFLKHQKTTLKT